MPVYQLGGIDKVYHVGEIDRIYHAGDLIWQSATEPAKVGALTISLEARSVTVSWDAPNDGGSPILDYRLEYRRSGTTNWTPVTLTGRTRTITNLASGQTYQFRVRARNAVGNGPWSDVRAVTAGIEVTVALPRATSDGAAFVQWSLGPNSRISIGSELSADGSEMFLELVQFLRTTGRISMRFAPSQTAAPAPEGPSFSDDFERNGTITFTASNGTSATVTGISDATEPYLWIPSNSLDIVALANAIAGLQLNQRTLTVTFSLGGSVAPAPTPDPDPTPTAGVTLTLTAAASGDNVGAFGQHRDPIPGGLLSPRTFTIGGKNYGIRGWFVDSANRLQINMDTDQQEADFRAAGLTVDLGQGDSFDSGDTSYSGGVIFQPVTTDYVAGQQYTIRITD